MSCTISRSCRSPRPVPVWTLRCPAPLGVSGVHGGGGGGVLPVCTPSTPPRLEWTLGDCPSPLVIILQRDNDNNLGIYVAISPLQSQVRNRNYNSSCNQNHNKNRKSVKENRSDSMGQIQRAYPGRSAFCFLAGHTDQDEFSSWSLSWLDNI